MESGATSWRVADTLSAELTGIPEVSKVVVRIVAGDVTVAAGPSARVDVRRLSGADVMVEVRDGTLYVSQPDADSAPIERFIKMFTEGKRHRCSATITAPAAAKVSVTTVSGEVVASGFEGGTRVKTVSGDVTLSTLRHEVDVKTVSGDIEAKDIAAGLKLKSVSGDMAVVDGACSWVDAKSVSGDVLLDLDLDPSGTYDISTVSGEVAVRTVAEPNLSVDVTSVSGRLVSDFGFGWEHGPGRRRASHTIGSGGARLWVKTVSGDLRVLRGREAAA
jgi:hypothetical protein